MRVEDQGSDNAASTAQGAESTQPVAKNEVNFEALVAEMKAKNDALEKDNRGYRDRIRTMSDNDEEIRKKRGDFEPLLKDRDTKIAEYEAQLAATKDDAQKWRDYLAKEGEAVNEMAKALSEDDRKLVEAVPDVKTRRALIAKLTPSAAPTTEKKPAGLPPPSKVSGPSGNGAGKPFSIV